MWRLGTQLFVVCVICCLTGLAVLPVTALGEGLPSGEGGGSSSSLSGALVSPLQPSAEGEQAGVRGRAKPMSAAAAKTREESRTKFEHLGPARAAQVAREAFPAAIEQLAGGPPSLPAGQRIVGYVAPNAAQLALPGGKHAVVASMQPIAVETSPGHRAPVDLGLTKSGRCL